MDCRQLRYFVTVARERNFTRAAEKLGISQPPLSRSMQQLEEELGISLIDRESRPLGLTDAGRLLFQQAVQILNRIDDTVAMVRRLREAKTPRLALGFVPSTLYSYLPEVIQRYRARRREVEVTLLELTTLEQIGALKEGRIDIGFGRIPLDDAGIERTLLRNEKLSVALPLTHPLASRVGSLHMTELTADTLLAYPKSPRPSYADQILALFEKSCLKPRAVYEVRELQTALGLVAAETGICVVPSSVERFRRDNIVYRALDHPDAVSPIFLSTRKGDKSQEIDVILGIVKEIYLKEGIPFGV